LPFMRTPKINMPVGLSHSSFLRRGDRTEISKKATTAVGLEKIQKKRGRDKKQHGYGLCSSPRNQRKERGPPQRFELGTGKEKVEDILLSTNSKQETEVFAQDLTTLAEGPSDVTGGRLGPVRETTREAARHRKEVSPQRRTKHAPQV